MTKNQNLDEKSKFYQKSGKSHLIIFPRVIIFRKFRIDFPRTNLDPTQIRDDGDLIWVIRLKLSPTIDNIHDFPQGVEYISKIQIFQNFLFLHFSLVRSSASRVPVFHTGQTIIIDRIQEKVNSNGAQIRTALDPPILRFSDDIGFSINSENKLLLTDDFGESYLIDSVDEPIYTDLKKLINEDSSVLYSDQNDLNPLLNRPPKLPQHKIENIATASEYFSIR